MIGVIYTTFGNTEDAHRLGNEMLNAKLIVCSNYFPIDSQYIWNNELQHDNEIAVFFKTSREKLEEAITFLEKYHPYEVPLINSHIREVNDSYLEWMRNQL